MIALEMRNLGGGEILHACPQESLDKPCPVSSFIMALPRRSWSTATLRWRWPRRVSG
jgi:hypothetical protein